MNALTLTDTRLPAATEEAVRLAGDRARSARAPNTRRAYEADWRDFEATCAGLSLPARPDAPTVAVYIDQLARRGAKVSTIRRRIAALNTRRRLDGQEPLSTREEPLASVLRGIRRDIGSPPRQARPVEIEELRQVLAACPSDTLGRRDRALLLLGFAGAFRRSELSGLDWTPEDDGTAYVSFVPEGARITLKRSKTNQTGESEQVAICRGAYVSTCPVKALEEWREASFATGPVFRSVSRGGTISADRLEHGSVARIIRRSVARAAAVNGATPAEVAATLDRLSGHSLRAGLVTTCFAMGLSESDVQRQTRHRDLKTLIGYRRHATAFVGNVSGKVGL